MHKNNRTQIYSLARGPDEFDEWYLVHEDTGKQFVVYEGYTCHPVSGANIPKTTQRVAVKTILAQGNELSQKLREKLET